MCANLSSRISFHTYNLVTINVGDAIIFHNIVCFVARNSCFIVSWQRFAEIATCREYVHFLKVSFHERKIFNYWFFAGHAIPTSRNKSWLKIISLFCLHWNNKFLQYFYAHFFFSVGMHHENIFRFSTFYNGKIRNLI